MVTAQRAFAQKELLEFLRTWRIWLLLLPMLLFAIGGPIFTWFAPEIFSVTLEAYGDIEVSVPEPTWLDSYTQWTNNQKRIMPLVLLVIAGGAVANEIASGSLLPILAGGLTRRDFILIKFGVISAMGILAITIGSITNWLVGRVFFPDIPLRGALLIVGVASLLSLVLVALALFASTFMPDALSAVGMEMVIFLLLSIAALWPPASRFTPAGLLTSLSDLARYGEANWLAPALSSLIFTAILLIMAVTIFQRREL